MKRAASATLAIGAVLLAASVSGCSAGSPSSTVKESSSASAPASASATASASAAADTVTAPQATIKTAKAGDLGMILVNQNGRTMYLFEADKTAKSTCYGACAAAWPPMLTSGNPKSTGGVKSGLLKTTKRNDGTTQVTYNGHPLYLYAGDSKAGDTHGQGLNQFGALWYVLDTNGKKVDKS